MSIRTLVEDAMYRGGALFSRGGVAWRVYSPRARMVVLVLVLVLLLLWWFGPRLGLYGDRPGGFTDEELRLIERAGSSGGGADGLPWWYRD